MSNEFFKEFLNLIQSIPIPTRDLQNEQAKRHFRLGYDMVNTWSGHPDTLIDALKLFMASQSRAHVYAGIAFVLSSASYESANNYEAEGLEYAFRWLKMGGKLVEQERDLGLVEAQLYLRSKRLEDAQKKIQQLSKLGDKDYYFCDIAIQYWYNRGDVEKVEKWFTSALPLASTISQQLNLQRKLAGFYLMHNLYAQAVPQYQELLSLDPENPWSWHNLSICYLNLDNLDEAERCNQKALVLMEFGAARGVQQTLAKRRVKGK